MSIKLIASVFGLSLICAACVSGAQIADSINGSATPAAGFHWVASEEGWFYTPSFSYSLTGIQTKYGADVDSRTVTLEFYDAFPTAGGILLRTGGFTPLASVFAGIDFAPLSLVSGHQYFLGFRNTRGLSLNATSDVGRTVIDPLRWDSLNNGTYNRSETGGNTGSPILLFLTPAGPSVPEPSNVSWLLAACIVGSFACRKFVRRSRSAGV